MPLDVRSARSPEGISVGKLGVSATSSPKKCFVTVCKVLTTYSELECGFSVLKRRERELIQFWKIVKITPMAVK